MSRLPSVPLQRWTGLVLVAALAAAAAASVALYVSGLRPEIEALAMAVIFAGGAVLGWAERRRRLRGLRSEVEEKP